MRLSRCEVRDHINWCKNDRWHSYRFLRAMQRLKSPKRYVCEIFGAPRLSSFSTQSATFGSWRTARPPRGRAPRSHLCWRLRVARDGLQRRKMPKPSLCSGQTPTTLEPHRMRKPNAGHDKPPCSILYGLNCRWVQKSNRDLLLHPKTRQTARSTEECYRWQLRVDHVSSRRVQ